MDDEETPEPCPAAFDLLVSCLLAWGRMPTLDAWALEANRQPERFSDAFTRVNASEQWAGPRRIVAVAQNSKERRLAELEADDEPRPLLTWPEMQARLERLHSR